MSLTIEPWPQEVDVEPGPNSSKMTNSLSPVLQKHHSIGLLAYQ